jgi:L-alanine-DL-glutamate epimerase-like enolase superfamily enzyme
MVSPGLTHLAAILRMCRQFYRSIGPHQARNMAIVVWMNLQKVHPYFRVVAYKLHYMYIFRIVLLN